MESLESYFSAKHVELYSFIFRHMVPEPILEMQIANDKFVLEEGRKDDEEWFQTRNVGNLVRKFIWTGSRFETLTIAITPIENGDFTYLMSDYDVMVVLDGYTVVENENMTDAAKNEIIITAPASHAGYTKLFSRRDGSIFTLRYDADLSGTVHVFPHILEVNEMTKIFQNPFFCC